jgi:hypothetical protein
MKNFLVLTAIICFFSPFVKAQSVTWNDPMPSKFHWGRNNLTLDDIQGSPYLDNEYKVGTILTDDGVLYKDIPLRYNCFDDVLEFKKDKEAYDLLPKTKIKRAEFGGQVFAFKDIESDGGKDKSFLQILAEGKATLLARFGVKFYEAEELRGFADPKPARFGDLSEIYYVSVNNAPAQKILSNKKLVEVLRDKRKEIENYMSKQKISIKKVDDLKKIIAYYNSL